MINHYLFEMSDSDLNRFEMIYVLSFRNDREKFSSPDLFWLLNTFWSPDRRDGNTNFRPCGLFVFVRKREKHVFLKREWNFPKLYM